MRRLAIALAFTALLALALVLGLSSLAAQLAGPPPFDPVAYEQQQQEIARLAALAPLDVALAAFWRVLPAVALAGGLLYLASLGVAHVARFRHERQPNSAGLLPVRAERLDDVAPAALASFHQARIEEARRPNVPMQLHYSPSHRVDGRGAPELSALEPAALAAPELPGVIDLADVGHAPSVGSILLGLGAGGERIAVPMKSLWHIALAGPTGNGKSNIARMVVAQLLAIGAKVCVGDPKWTEYDAAQDEDWRPIARRLARSPAYDAKGIGALLKWATGELEKRLGLRRAGERPGSPIFIYLDELPWIAAHVPNAAAMIGELVRVGRGVGLFLLVGAQDMLAKTIDLSAERDNFRTGFYLGGDDTTGAILLGIPKREVSDPDGVGCAWLRSTATTPPQQVRVPYASNRAIHALLGDGSEAMADLSPASRPASYEGPPMAREVGGEVRGEAGASGVLTLTARDRHILSLVRQQKGITEIIAEVWGVKGGAKFGEYSAEVMRVIAQAVQSSN